MWRKSIRKKTNIHDNKLHDVATDALTNIETVKYFCSEAYEARSAEQATQGDEGRGRWAGTGCVRI